MRYPNLDAYRRDRDARRSDPVRRILRSPVAWLLVGGELVWLWFLRRPKRP